MKEVRKTQAAELLRKVAGILKTAEQDKNAPVTYTVDLRAMKKLASRERKWTRRK